MPKSAGFPFLALVEHTNYLSPQYFGGDHIVYVGDYLEADHEYFFEESFNDDDSRTYTGAQKNELRHGKGVLEFSNGQKYTGEFKGVTLDGKGTLTLPDGTKYTGEFRDNKRHGQGTCEYSDGRIETGEWINDEKQDENIPHADQNFIEPVTGMEMIWVPGGEFAMGGWDDEARDNAKPIHQVELDGFWLGKFPVTQGQYQRIVGSNPSRFKNGDNFPVERVSWDDAQEYILGLKRQSGLSFRLPTEAEWEYAARSGGRKEKYAGGNSVDAVAWYDNNSGKTTHRVGTKDPNGWGIYDMSGNVAEFCLDCTVRLFGILSRGLSCL